MMEERKIPTEIIQRLSPFHAWEYRLVPYAVSDDGKLLCYGHDDVDWDAVLPEAEVIAGETMVVEPAAGHEIVRLLNKYYRRSGNAEGKGSLSAMGDRFLLRLIEEAFHNYASDIHFECYEERCRVRFRMDGQLIERYVIEKQNYKN